MMNEQAALPMSANEVWGKLIQVLWDENALVEGLYQTIKHNLKQDTYQVIDVSGGTGFPLIGLNAKTDIIATYNDSSQEMHALFSKRSGGKIPAHTYDWRSMAAGLDQTRYDVAMCRGNSLIYVDSWEGALTKSEEQIILDLQKAIDNFFAILKPGGLLYLDKNKQVQPGSYGLQKIYSLEEEEIAVDWLFTNNLETNVRSWKNKVTINGKTYEDMSYGYLLTEELLERLCYNAGFIQFQKVQVQGEDIYQSYLVKKPDANSQTFAYYNEQNKIYRKIWNENGQICWGRYEQPDLTFSDAGLAHISYMASIGKIDANAKILDIGCGNGMTSMYLADTFGCHVVGVDPTVTNIQEANKANTHEQVQFVCDVVREGLFEEQSFTHIWSNAAICHISKQERIELFQLLRKLIKPGGTLIFDDAFTPDKAKRNARADIHFYRRLHYDDLFDEREYRDVLAQSGFEVEHFEDISLHFVKSYEVLSERAASLGYPCLANDYLISAQEGENRSMGWLLFCGKAG